MENLNVILRYVLFFCVGVFQDIFITYYYQMISKERAFRAGFFSAVVTLVNLVVLYEILVGIEDQILSIILVYAAGNGVGTSLVIKKHQIIKFFSDKIKSNKLSRSNLDS